MTTQANPQIQVLPFPKVSLIVVMIVLVLALPTAFSISGGKSVAVKDNIRTVAQADNIPGLAGKNIQKGAAKNIPGWASDNI